jgi:hypothetical protein
VILLDGPGAGEEGTLFVSNQPIIKVENPGELASICSKSIQNHPSICFDPFSNFSLYQASRHSKLDIYCAVPFIYSPLYKLSFLGMKDVFETPGNAKGGSL